MRLLLRSIAVAGAVACGPPPRPHYHFVMPMVPAGGPGTCEPVMTDKATCPRVVVRGQVMLPRLVRYEAGLTIIGAVAACGGMTQLANGRRATVIRVVDGTPHRYEVSIGAILESEEPDLVLRAGDVVYVPQGDL